MVPCVLEKSSTTELYPYTWQFFVVIFFGGVPGIKPRALCVLSELATMELHPSL